MKPLFTVHGGEFVVGSYIEENYKVTNNGHNVVLGKNEKQILDEVELSLDHKIKRQCSVIG
ncbi:hypothetical protein LCGC14_1436450, partial [marine sediment metagenome]